ncbi:MAG: hypothetical protein N2643_01985 [Endomicrobia bacterium]|nr:hypothetical protein [Endomicrobiia bacterium]
MKKIILISGLLLFQICLFSNEKKEVKKEDFVIFEDEMEYVYTYPEDGSYSLTQDVVKSGKFSLAIWWSAGKGEYCGTGIAGKNLIDITSFRDKGVLSFYIKGDKGKEKVVRVGIMDWAERYTYRPLNVYIKEITTKWQKVEIPLFHFSENGYVWDEGQQKEISAKIDFNKIKLLVMDFGEGDGKKNKIYIDEIKIFSYGAEKFGKFVPVELPEGVISFFEDQIQGYAYTYPEGGLYSEDFRQKVSGSSSLRVIWRGKKGEYCGFGVALPEPVDISKVRDTGYLEFYIKGEKGIEIVEKVGIMDEDNFYSTRMLARARLPVVPDKWTKVSIPLNKFSDEALKWDEEEQKEIPGDINWKKIKTFTLDFGEGNGEENIIYLDEVRIVPAKKEEKK